ncbi:MAG: hypothetical protein ACXWK3_18740 [Reyranella sp.]
MISRIKAIWRRWSLAKLPNSGKEIRVARYVDISIGDEHGRAGEAPIDRILGRALRTPTGRRLSIEAIRRLSLMDKKIAFEGVVECHSRLQGIAIFEKQQLRAFLAATRSASGESALNELAEQFIARCTEVNCGLYLELRASAAATAA